MFGQFLLFNRIKKDLKSNRFFIFSKKRVKKYQVITKLCEIFCCLVIFQLLADHRNTQSPFLSSFLRAYVKCWHAGCPKGIEYHLQEVVNIRLCMYHAVIMTVCSKAEETSRTGEKCTAPVSTTDVSCSFLNTNPTGLSQAGNCKAQSTSATQFAVAGFAHYRY